jgi:hypothetical protein
MKKTNLTKKTIVVVLLISCFCIGNQKVYAQSVHYYNECGSAKPLKCDTNTITFLNVAPIPATDAVVWYSFTATTVVQASIYFAANSANIYSIKIYGPFSSPSSKDSACRNPTLLTAKTMYNNSFPQTPTFTTPILNFPLGLYIFQVQYKKVIRVPQLPNAVFYVNMNCANPKLDCTNCIGSFAPQQGEYILSAWVKEEIINPNVLTYTKPQIYIDFPPSPPSTVPLTAEGSIIDGWQRIEKEFSIAASATFINLRLQCVSGNCFFDDIRIFPKDGSMKSYVYDPITLRLVAELDERNYATLYEYDEEGKLVRVKKETEKGIMTIKENKNSTKKKP